MDNQPGLLLTLYISCNFNFVVLSEPRIDGKYNAARAMYVCMYVCMYMTISVMSVSD